MQTLSRENVLREIQALELKLAELRAMLPTALKSFFRFRGKPFRYCMVYALDREQAEAKLFERLAEQYGPDGFTVHPVVDTYATPQAAAANSQGNLLACLSRADVQEFLADWEAEQVGRVDDPSKPEHLPKSQLERDIDVYRYRLQSQT